MVRVAEQIIVHDGDHPSHILLPVIPAGTRGGDPRVIGRMLLSRMRPRAIGDVLRPDRRGARRRTFPPLGRTEAAYDVNAGRIVREKSPAVALIAILVIAVTGSLTGQQRPAPSRAATLDDVLEELRAFRSECGNRSARESAEAGEMNPSLIREAR
jgi:hypothetical protein